MKCKGCGRKDASSYGDGFCSKSCISQYIRRVRRNAWIAFYNALRGYKVEN